MNIEEQIKEKAGCKGVYVFTKAKLELPEHFALNNRITEIRNEIQALCSNRGDRRKLTSTRIKIERREKLMLSLIRELNSKCKTEKIVVDNIIPTVMRAMLANNLTSISPTNLPLIKYAEVGTGTNSPANGDTALQTSSYRNAIASRTNASNVAYATAFFNATETTGTYREAGIFSDGSASAGTGILSSRVAINITKSNTETLTLDWSITIS